MFTFSYNKLFKLSSLTTLLTQTTIITTLITSLDIDCRNLTQIQSTERSEQLTIRSKTVGLTQQVNDGQPKGLFRRIGGWIGRGFRAKRRHPVDGRRMEMQDNHTNEVLQFGPVWQNTSSELLGQQSYAGCDGEADTTEPTHTDIRTSMTSSTTRPSSSGQCLIGKEKNRRDGKGLVSDDKYPNKVLALTEQEDEASEGTATLLTHRTLTKGNKLAELNGIDSSAPVMAGCVDTLHVDSRGRARWGYARRSERGADPVHAKRDQSTRDSKSSQRKGREDSKHCKSTLNGGNERKGSRSDPNRFDMESAAAVRVEVSEDDIRVVAIESIVPTDGHNIQDFKARESTLKRLLKNKKFVKVKSDGDRRYVMKANGRTSFWSWVRRLLCLNVEDRNQLRVTSRPILMAQNGREDDNKCEVHKNISDQQKGRKRVVRPVVCDPPLRTVGLLVREQVNKIPIKGRVPIDGQSKRSSAEVFFNRHKSLKESFDRIPYDKECDRIRRMDDSIVEPPIEKPLTEELRMSMCQTVRHCLPLLKSQDIKVYQSIARGGQGLEKIQCGYRRE